MANKALRLPENKDGNFYVDSSCINCGLSRHYAPQVFGDSGTHAFVMQQPNTPETVLAAKQALLACPTASIGTVHKTDLESARATFPISMAEDVFLTGFNSRKSFGAHSYFVQSANGNWLIDSPRFTGHLVSRLEQMGGLKYILLTHRDDVADAQAYARHFSATRIIHALERDAQPDAEMILSGEETTTIDDANIVFAPGHTAGHIVMLWQNRYLFTGDHLAYIQRLNQLGAFKDYCWHSWDEQILSVQKLRAFDAVQWVFPGHGKWVAVEHGTFPRMIDDTVTWMRTQ